MSSDFGLGNSRLNLPALPQDWQWLQLRDLVDQNRGICYGIVQPGQHDPSGICMINTGDVFDGQVNQNVLFKVSKLLHQKFKRSTLQGGEVLYTLVGANFGRVAITPKEYIGYNCSRNVGVIPVLSDAAFIMFVLRSPLAQYYKNTWANTTAQPTLNLKELGEIPIPWPPESSRHDISNLLEGIDNRIALLRETNTTLEAIAQALFKSWFVDFDPVHANAGTQAPSLPPEIQALFPATFTDAPQGPIPEGWTIARLGDITERITKGTTPTTLKKAFTETGINFVKVESLTESGEFITEKFAFIDEETHQLLKRSQLQVGDVLVTIAGTIGRVAEVTEDIVPANTNQAVALIRPIPENLPSGLIRRFLQLTDAKQRMGERVVQAVQANLSLGSLSDMLVVVPPKDTVGQLYDLGFAAIDSSKNNNLRQIRTLATLRDTLLPRLISGQLRLPEAQAAIEAIS